jgi:hypothetical protein
MPSAWNFLNFEGGGGRGYGGVSVFGTPFGGRGVPPTPRTRPITSTTGIGRYELGVTPNLRQCPAQARWNDPPSRWDMASGDGTFSIKGGVGGAGSPITVIGEGGGMDSYPPDPRWGRGSSAVEVCAGVPGHGRVSSEWQWRERALLGHTKIESTARYLRIAKRSDPIAISRAFNI